MKKFHRSSMALNFFEIAVLLLFFYTLFSIVEGEKSKGVSVLSVQKVESR